VTLDTTDAIALVIGIQMGGVLRFDPNTPTRLSVGTLLIREEGALDLADVLAIIQRGILGEPPPLTCCGG